MALISTEHTKAHYKRQFWSFVTLACALHAYLFKTRAPSQYPKRRLSVRSRKVSKPRDRYFKLSYRFEVWQAHRHHCYRSACHISERSDNSKYKSRGFETLRDLTERRLFGYWDGAQFPFELQPQQPKYGITIMERVAPKHSSQQGACQAYNRTSIPNESADMLSCSALYSLCHPNGSHSPPIWCWALTGAAREVTKRLLWLVKTVGAVREASNRVPRFADRQRLVRSSLTGHQPRDS